MQPAGLDLITYLDNTLGHHCPLCFFLEFDNSECPHKQTRRDVAHPPSNNSDLWSYNSSIASSRLFTSSKNTIRAKVSVASSDGTQPSLRRKRSPTGTTLRELNSQESLSRPQQFSGSQQNLLRTQQSDERLRKVYESQILTYLESPLSEFDPFKE